LHSDNIKSPYQKVGQVACWLVFIPGLSYAIITSIGLLSLTSPQDPIADPYFTIMETLTILIAPSMAISMVAFHYHASVDDRFFSLIALILLFIMASITSVVHFLILLIGHNEEAAQFQGFTFFFSFRWPSVVYALDILAWDWFFALSIFFAAQVFNKSKTERRLRAFLIICGMLSLAGLFGSFLHNMQIRNIGIIGYAVQGPVAFLFVGIVIGRQRLVSD
jgi:hypothetical protein